MCFLIKTCNTSGPQNCMLGIISSCDLTAVYINNVYISHESKLESPCWYAMNLIKPDARCKQDMTLLFGKY